MKTSELIQKLASELTPVSTKKTRNDLLIGLSCGATVSLLAIILVFGFQPGLIRPSHGLPLVVKVSYTLSLAAVASSMLVPMIRPGNPIPTRLGWLAAVALAFAGLALAQTAIASRTEDMALWFGTSWRQCSLRIVCLSLPVFVGVCWAIRQQAPVHLRAVGALAGLVSGGVAATLYALACTENGAGFVLVWYTLGIGIITGIGALVAPRVLRW
jgi:hypothetical protein